MALFVNRRSGVGSSILWGVGGILVGAGIAAALTPFSGTQLRSFVRDLMNMKGSGKREENVDSQLDSMENEGGVSHEVAPPLSSSKGFETSHS